jgi:hypothetical protein
VGDRLRPLWDFEDFDASRGAFRAQLEEETTDAGAPRVDQLARVEGLRGNWETCDALSTRRRRLAASPCAALPRARRRRARRSSPARASSSSWRRSELAQESGEEVLAVDAAHMLALVDDAEGGTARGIEIAGASDDPGVRYWLGPLYNNIGWTRFDAGDHAGALEAFELALAARERDDPRESSTSQHAARDRLSTKHAARSLARLTALPPRPAEQDERRRRRRLRGHRPERAAGHERAVYPAESLADPDDSGEEEKRADDSPGSDHRRILRATVGFGA